MKTSTIVLSLGITAVAVSCAPEKTTLLSPSRSHEIMRFRAIVDTSLGTVEVIEMTKTDSQSLEPVDIVQDGTPGSGPTNTVEFLVDAVSPVGCPTGAFCVTMRVRSFYAQPLNFLAVDLVSISEQDLHTVLNNDDPSKLGVWRYDPLIVANGSAAHDWFFDSNGTNFVVEGRVLASLCTL